MDFQPLVFRFINLVIGLYASFCVRDASLAPMKLYSGDVMNRPTCFPFMEPPFSFYFVQIPFSHLSKQTKCPSLGLTDIQSSSLVQGVALDECKCPLTELPIWWGKAGRTCLRVVVLSLLYFASCCFSCSSALG